MKAGQKNDKVMVRYLLGDLRGEDESRFEESYFENDEIYLQLKTVERDLIDAYVRGELSTREREQFETHYLSDPGRRQRVEFAKALARSFSRPGVRVENATARESVGWWQSLGHLLRVSNRRVVLVMTILLVVAGGSLLTIETVRLRNRLGRSEADTAALQQRQRDLEAQLAEKQRQTNQSAEDLDRNRAELDRLKRELASLQEPGSKPTTTIASFLLSASLVREAGERNRLMIPPGASGVRMQLSIDEDVYAKYRASLRTAEGAELWSGPAPNRRSGRAGKRVVLTLPAGLLSEGDYILALTGVTLEGELEGAGNYYFRVVRR
jgi:hypothetical protein